MEKSCRKYASAVSRAILKPVYRFGIPNSNSQMLKSVVSGVSFRQRSLSQSQQSDVLSYSERKNSQNVQGFAPGPHRGGLTAPPQTPRLHNGFFPRYAR